MKYDISHPDIPGIKIADPHFVFRGLTYGQWIGVWYNHLMSDEPDINYAEGGIVFLRGDLEHSYKVEEEHVAYSLMTRESRLIIPQGTAVFIPVIASMFDIDGVYQGQIMKDETSMRNAARRDTLDGGELGVRIKQKPDEDEYPLVKDLNDFFVESPLFHLSVSERNHYREYHEPPIEAGEYNSISAGIFIIISELPEGKTFRLSVFGKGVGKYLTRSVYDIEVSGELAPIKDVSEKEKPPVPPPAKWVPKFDPMDFVGKWGDPKPTKEI